jgi:NADH-quinone oxidoreductase subunit F
MREVIYDIAGGIRDGHTLKTYIPGGSSTGFMPPEPLDYPMDYEGVVTAGRCSASGSGGLIVMDETTPDRAGRPSAWWISTTTSPAASARPAARG